MRLKPILFTILAATSSLIAGFFVYDIAHATGEQWYWEGTTLVRAKGGELSPGIELKSTNNNDSTNPEFDANISNLAKGFEGGLRIASGGVGEDMPAGDLCFASTVTIKIDKSKNPNEVSIGKIQYKDKGGTMCYFEDNSKGMQLTGGPMRNTIGGDSTETILDEELQKQHDKLIGEYVQKQCGPTPTPECKTQAETSFNNQWDACMRRNATLGADQRLDAVARCVEQNTGLAIDTGAVRNGLIDIPDYEKEETSCTLEWIGYIICPMARFMAKITDKSFDALQSFLEIEPLGRGTKGGDSLYYAWSAMRNVANALFVIAFMVVIYSQLTGAGITNYGIKKLLPRIVIAAILVNASYYICVLAVDLANVLGNSLKLVLDNIAASLSPPEDRNWEGIIEEILVPGAAVATAAAVTITTAAMYLSFAAMVPLLTSVLLSLLMVVILLAGRYALIIMLIIITPIAFVAFLLPNTQKWFSKWLSTFITLLMLYPIISLIYGGAALASVIVMGSAGNRGGNDTLLPMFGLAIQALPLALTPIVMKFGGGVLNRFGGSVKNNGLFKGANSKAQGYADRKKDSRDLKALRNIGPNARGGIGGVRDRAIQKQYKRKALQDLRKGQLNNANADYISGYTSQAEGGGGDDISLFEQAKGKVLNRGSDADNPQYTPKNKGQKYAEAMGIAGGDGSVDRAVANALNVQLHMHQEVVEANKMTLRRDNTDSEIMNIAKGAGNHSEAVRQAAIELVAEQKDSDIDEVVKASASMTGQQRHALVSSIRKNGSAAASPYYSSPTAMQNILQGKVTADDFAQQVIAPSIGEGKFSAASLASADSAAIENIHAAMNETYSQSQELLQRSQQEADPAKAKKLADQAKAWSDNLNELPARAKEAQSNKYTGENLHPNSAPHIDAIKNWRPPTSP